MSNASRPSQGRYFDFHRFFWRGLLWLVLIFLLLAGLVVLLFLHLPDYRLELARWLGETLQQPVTIGEINTGWKDWQPVLVLTDVQIGQADHGQMQRIGALHLRLDIRASLEKAHWILGDIQVRDSFFKLVQPPPTASEPATEITTSGNPLLNWLLEQPHFSLRDVVVQPDEETALNLTIPALKLERMANSHRLQGVVTLPAIAPLQGGMLEVDLQARWPVPNSLSPVFSGRLQFQPQETAHHLISDIRLWQADNTWQLQLQPSPDADNPPPPLQLQLNRTQQVLNIHLSALPLAEYLDWLQPLIADTAVHQQLASLQAEGMLREINGQFSQHDWQAQLQLHDVHLILPEQIATLDNVSGQMTFGAQQGKLQISQGNVRAVMADMYTQPLSMQIKGSLRWQTQDEGWRLQFGQMQIMDTTILHTRMMLNGQLDLLPAAAPISDLHLRMDGGQINQLYRYVPDHVLPVTARWLKKGLLAGDIVEIEATLSGALDKAFDSATGFQLNAQLKGVHLNYEHGWPHVHDINADLQIHGREMLITSRQARVFNSHARSIKITIDNIAKDIPLLTVDTHLDSNAEDGLRFLRESPLHEDVPIEELLDIRGAIEIELGLTIPLGPLPDRSRVKILFQDNTLSDKQLGMQFKHLRGALVFAEGSVRADALQVELLDQPMQLAIHSEKSMDAAIVQLRGQADAAFLQARLAEYGIQLPADILQTYLHGYFDWQVRLSLPLTQTADDKVINIHVETDLQGFTLLLPAPFDKPASTARKLDLQAHLQAGRLRRLSMDYGDVLRAHLQFTETGTLSDGLLYFGGGDVPQSEYSGLNIQGTVPDLSVAQWQTLLESIFATAGKTDTSDGLSLLNRINLRFEQLTVSGQHFEAVDLQLQQSAEQWQGIVSSPRFQANITVSRYQNHPQVTLLFKHLYLMWPDNIAESSATSVPIPSALPALIFHCEDLRVGNWHLGSMRFYTHPSPVGMNLELHLQSAAMNLAATGYWQMQQATHHTHLEMTLDSADIGQLLPQFGFDKPPIVGSSLSVQTTLDWPAALYLPLLTQLGGDLRLKMGSGQIVDIEPGAAGRAIGLVDIWSLPRRLQLDFQDIFDSGLGFDSVEGRFQLGQGLLSIRHLLLEGPAALVKVQGDTDLLHRRYNQVVTVIPRVANALPIAGALAGGAGVGAAAFLLQKLLEESMSELVYYQYHISGPWDNPDIAPIHNGIAESAEGRAEAAD